jgi:hypothetical protein
MRRTRCVYEGHLTGGSLALVAAPQLDDEPVPEETGAVRPTRHTPCIQPYIYVPGCNVYMVYGASYRDGPYGQPTDLWTVDGGQAVGATPRALELLKQQQQRLLETQISAQRQRQEERRVELDRAQQATRGLLMGMMGGGASRGGAESESREGATALSAPPSSPHEAR